jgi:hypothetical protein
METAAQNQVQNLQKARLQRLKKVREIVWKIIDRRKRM